MKTRVPGVTAAPGFHGTWNHLPGVGVGGQHRACSLLRGPGARLRPQGQPSPSSCEMPSTDLWGMLHSRRDLVRSENRLRGTSIVSTLQGP